MGGLWEGLAEEAEGPCFKGLMVTVDKEWVGILAEEYLSSSFCFLACWGLPEMILLRCSLLSSFHVLQTK